MYSHKILGFPLWLIFGATLIWVVVDKTVSGTRNQLILPVALGCLWLSYFLTHFYHHYILMDIIIVCTFISRLTISNTNRSAVFIALILSSILFIVPASGHSRNDKLFIAQSRQILTFLSENRHLNVVSPAWLKPHWILGDDVPTYGIHPEWSTDLIGRYKFKSTPIAKKFGLDVSWQEQCGRWAENADVLIVSEYIMDMCGFYDKFDLLHHQGSGTFGRSPHNEKYSKCRHRLCIRVRRDLEL